MALFPLLKRDHYSGIIRFNPIEGTKQMSDDLITDDEQESTTETLADYDISIGGVSCKVIYLGELPHFFSSEPRPSYQLDIPFDGAERVLEALESMPEELIGVTIKKYRVVDAITNFEIIGNFPYSLKYEVAARRRQLRHNELSQQYAAQLQRVQERIEALEKHGIPMVNSDIHVSVRKLPRMTGERILEHHASGALPSLLKHIEKELDRLETASPKDEFIQGLVSGALSHRHAMENQRIIGEALRMSIRTGGYIDPISDEMLGQFYRARLDTATSPEEFYELDFRLDRQAYLPDDDMLELMAADPDLQLAPDQVILPGNKGEAVYSIKYDLIKRDGKEIPSGIIEVSLATYRRLAPEYGKKSGFPTLPHNIQLFVRVICDLQLVAEGFDTIEFGDRVRKAEKARERAKHADQVVVVDKGEVPPWFHGVNKPGRRR